jgi:tetrahydromethanopterin S-methyltransferase subunit E
VGIPIAAVGLILKSTVIKKVGLVVLVAAGLTAVPAYLSGEPAEKVVKNYPGASRHLIHTHEDSALYSLIAIEVIAVLSLLFLLAFYFNKNIPNPMWVALITLSVGAVGMIMNTAHLGGEIRHEEIRSEVPSPDIN